MVNPKERISIHCDADSLWFQAKKFGELQSIPHCRLDYEKLRHRCQAGRDLVGVCRVYFRPRPSLTNAAFHRALEHMGYDVIPVEGSRTVFEQQIVGDLIASTADVVILVTGEGNYTHAARRICVRGGVLEVRSFPSQRTLTPLKDEINVRFLTMGQDFLQARKSA